MEWRPFELRPGTPPEGIPRRIRPGDIQPGDPVGGHLGEMAKEAGLVMRRSPLTPNSRPALEATEFAKEKGRFDEFHQITMKAYWEECRNIGDTAVLRELVEAAALDWDEFSHHLKKKTYSPRIEQQSAEAHSIGVTGIPAYIIDRYFFMGAQPYPLFQRVMEQVLSEQE